MITVTGEGHFLFKIFKTNFHSKVLCKRFSLFFSFLTFHFLTLSLLSTWPFAVYSLVEKLYKKFFWEN